MPVVLEVVKIAFQQLYYKFPVVLENKELYSQSCVLIAGRVGIQRIISYSGIITSIVLGLRW